VLADDDARSGDQAPANDRKCWQNSRIHP
jgi:hypothetical protein